MLRQLSALLVRDLQSMKDELVAFPSEAMIWECPQGITNPAGTLALHGCGNLQHYIGHVLGGTSYVRDRENEFANRSMTRADLSMEIDRTIAVIKAVLPSLEDEVLASTFPQQVGGVSLNTQQFLLHLSSHLSLHLGQAGYLRRILTGSTESTGPGNVRVIAEG